MTEKKPEAGEFWEWAGCRLRVIGTRNNGAIVAEHECGSLEFGCVAGEMKHLPECDSFEWQPEPQETPTREYVRLFCHWSGQRVFFTTMQDDYFNRELKHDGTGFYLADG